MLKQRTWRKKNNKRREKKVLDDRIDQLIDFAFPFFAIRIGEKVSRTVFFSYRKVTQKFLTSVFFSRSVWLKTIRLPAARAGGFFSPCWSSSSFLFVWSFIKQSTETIRISSIVRLRFVEFLEETQIIVNNRRQTTCSLCFVVFGITKTLIIIEIIKEYWRKKESQ